MPDIPDEAVKAALARRSDLLADLPDPAALSEETLTRLMLEAAAPILAEAWGLGEGMTATTEHGTRMGTLGVMRPHPSIQGTPVVRTAIYGPWEVPDGQ